MAALAQTVDQPVWTAEQFELEVVLELATSDDLASGLAGVVEQIRLLSGAARVEWWLPAEDTALELAATTGEGSGRLESVDLGPTGVLVIFGGRPDPGLESALASALPIVRRRRAEEQLALTAMQLAKRNEALEEFAALVAHELKSPLQAALLADDPADSVEQALDLVDGLLEAARAEATATTSASLDECLEEAMRDLNGVEAEVTSEGATTLPLPPASLRVILRNLLKNAVAAGARSIHVTAAQSTGSWRLCVDDDGVGLAAVDEYRAGSGIGLGLCRQIAGRLGGELELTTRAFGGTRATLLLEEVPQ